MEDLVEMAKCGDEEAFISLILQKQLSFYKICKARIRNEDDIQDIIQDAIILAYTKIHDLKNNSKFYLWFYKILINQCNKFYKNNSKKITHVSFDTLENNASISSNKNFDDIVLYDAMLNFLEYDERLIVLLFYDNNYTTKEIGEILNKNENTIKSNLKRIREKLKKEFEGGTVYE